VGQIFDAIAWLLQLFLFALIARLILDYVRVFRPQWRPQGVVLALAELVYTITDRPLRYVRRFVPPLQLGGVSLDLSFIVVFFVVQLLIRLVLAL
jgi:YggT family protein